MARGYTPSHGENLQENNAPFAKNLTLEWDKQVVLLQWRKAQPWKI